MIEVARLMENRFTNLHLSQIPLTDSTGNIQRIVTGNGLARWGKSGRPDATAYEYSEEALRFPKETPLREIMNKMEDFGYVLVTDQEGCVRIVTYSDVLAAYEHALGKCWDKARRRNTSAMNNGTLEAKCPHTLGKCLQPV